MRNMKIGRCCLAGLFLWIVQGATAQINYGTTGLMNLPTADMQRDKTFYGRWQLAESSCHSTPLVV